METTEPKSVSNQKMGKLHTQETTDDSQGFQNLLPGQFTLSPVLVMQQNPCQKHQKGRKPGYTKGHSEISLFSRAS